MFKGGLNCEEMLKGFPFRDHGPVCFLEESPKSSLQRYSQFQAAIKPFLNDAS
jgi:hypothetical protein